MKPAIVIPKTRLKFDAASPNMKIQSPTANAVPGSIATLVGTPLVWNALSRDRGGYKVRLMPNSAQFTNPTMALFAHSFSAVLGNTANKTLRMVPTDAGVNVEIDLPNTSTAKDVQELIDKKYIGGMSFTMANGFEECFSTTENGENILNATKYTVDEVTVCANPAFTATTITVAPEEDEDPEQDDSIPPGSATPPGGMSAADHAARIKWERNRLYIYGV